MEAMEYHQPWNARRIGFKVSIGGASTNQSGNDYDYHKLDEEEVSFKWSGENLCTQEGMNRPNGVASNRFPIWLVCL